MLFLKIKTSEHVSPFVLSIIERATKCNDLDDAQTSFEFLDGFLAHFTAFLDNCLTEINPNWNEEYYN
jgi:hypothetical protein